MNQALLEQLAMEALGMQVERLVQLSAGKPLAFVLVCSDGNQIAVTGNMPARITAALLTHAQEDAAEQARFRR